VNSVVGPQPEMEAEAIDGESWQARRRPRCKPTGDPKERIGVICIHVLDDSRRDIGERIRKSASVVLG
jgi:hypothetical protein